jgi:hypothetical protein
MPMVDMATYTIKYIKRLTLTQVSKKVKSNFFRVLIRAWILLSCIVGVDIVVEYV